jgi:hypothetical protein
MGDRRKAADAAPALANGTERSARARVIRLLRVPTGERVGTANEQLEQLEREVMLLREENARLKVAREHARDRPVNERVRAAFQASQREDDPDGDGDEPWEVLTECMLLRDGLVDACRELERGARELRARLETLLPGAEGTDADRGMRSHSDFEGVV